MKSYMSIIIGIFLLLFVSSCGKKEAKYLTEDEQIEAVVKLLKKASLTEAEWNDLENYLKPENRKSLYLLCEKDMDDAIKNKNWRLLKIATKHGFGFKINKSWRWDVIENKGVNYNGDDILKFYSSAGFEIDDYVVRTALKTNYDLAVFLLKNMPKNKRDFINWKGALNDPKMLRAAMDAGFVDFDRALLECEKSSSPDIEVFNKLLRWKRQTSKVWTLY